MQRQMLQDILTAYLSHFPEEKHKFVLLQSQLADNESMNTRKNFRGHATGAAVILSPDRHKLLLIHHKVFDKWLQPGGHWDTHEPDPWTAARREAEEETSVHIAKQLPVFDDIRIPLDIDTHAIKARPEKNEPPHYHHDFRYVFLAEDETLQFQAAEVYGSSWVAFDDPKAAQVQPLIAKLRRRGII